MMLMHLHLEPVHITILYSHYCFADAPSAYYLRKRAHPFRSNILVLYQYVA